MASTSQKPCAKCGEVKPLEEFHRSSKASDGRQSWCKACHDARNREWKRNNRDRAAELEKLRREQDPERFAEINRRYRERHPERTAEQLKCWRKQNPERAVELQERYNERYPEKARAHQAVNNAIQRGKIIKPTACEDCGNATNAVDLHGHHEDYSRPLDVEWLCRGCHAQRHALVLAA